MSDDVDGLFDPADYVAQLHRMKVAERGAHLAVLLRDPATSLPLLRVYVTEVGLMLTRVMFLRDYEAVDGFLAALEPPLEATGILGPSRAFPGSAGGDAELRLELIYYLGRLVTILVTARRFRVMDRVERLRREHLDGGMSQAVLEMLQEGGAQSQKLLKEALKARASARVHAPNELHAVLKRLTRDEVIAQRTGVGRALVFELTELGQQLLQQAPPWMDDVEDAYRSHRRLQAGGLPVTATQRRLLDLFERLDREAGLASADARARAPQDAFPFVDAARLPGEAERGLPRILP